MKEIVMTKPKEKNESFENFGINKINCNDCSEKYFDRNRRAVRTRYGEHLSHWNTIQEKNRV